MDLGEVIIIGALGGMVFGVSCLSGVFGSRGIEDEYTTQYRGKPAIVQRNDVIWGPDKYWISLSGKDKIKDGTIITDDSKIIEISENRYSVKDYNYKIK